MQIRPYTQDDFQTLNRMLKGHNCMPVTDDELPRLGYIAHRNGLPVAIAFIRFAEGNIALAESLVTDPRASPALASDAIDLVIEKLSQVAKDLKIKYLIAWTLKKSIAKRISKKHGFNQTEQIMLVKTP